MGTAIPQYAGQHIHGKEDPKSKYRFHQQSSALDVFDVTLPKSRGDCNGQKVCLWRLQGLLLNQKTSDKETSFNCTGSRL